MKFTKLIAIIIIVGLIVPIFGTDFAFAAVGVTSSELQEANSIVLPTASSSISLKGYDPFALKNRSNVNGGISAQYEARLKSNPFLSQELPQLKVLIFTYSAQEAAEQAFFDMSKVASSHTIIKSEDRSIFFKSSPGGNVDLFNTITSEDDSVHLLHINGNLLYQISVYRESGEYNRENIVSFSEAINDTDGIKILMEDMLKQIKLSLGLLFPPTGSDFSAKSGKSSLILNDLYEIPKYGSVEFKLYIGDPLSAVGTVIDSSGLTTPEMGDIYLYVQKDGKIQAGIYAPGFDANCQEQSGWYRILSTKPVRSYEWNNIKLSFGIGGFNLFQDGVQTSSCSVSVPRSQRPLYFGDFPNDSIEESMIGYVDKLKFTSATTDDGQIWDEVLTNQLFFDLSNSDSNLMEFQFLKNKGIMVGSDGMLYPDNTLNRAEMVKLLLKAFDYDSSNATGSTTFWDVPVGSWYEKYLITASSIGMIKGHDDGRFLPGHEINRAEFFTMLERISKEKKSSYSNEFDDVGAADWYSTGAIYASKHGLISGVTFGPNELITRRAAAKVLYSLLK